jgi:hypothetical protein
MLSSINEKLRFAQSVAGDRSPGLNNTQVESLVVKETPIKTTLRAGCWWLMPVILATQEAEIRRITAQSQLRQIVCETLS